MTSRDMIWEAMTRDNPNLDGVLKKALDQAMPVIDELLAESWCKGVSSGMVIGGYDPSTNPHLETP